MRFVYIISGLNSWSEKNHWKWNYVCIINLLFFVVSFLMIRHSAYGKNVLEILIECLHSIFSDRRWPNNSCCGLVANDERVWNKIAGCARRSSQRSEMTQSHVVLSSSNAFWLWLKRVLIVKTSRDDNIQPVPKIDGIDSVVRTSKKGVLFRVEWN